MMLVSSPPQWSTPASPGPGNSNMRSPGAVVGEVLRGFLGIGTYGGISQATWGLSALWPSSRLVSCCSHRFEEATQVSSILGTSISWPPGLPRHLCCNDGM